MQIKEVQHGFEISFPFDYFKVKAVKQIPGARFYGKSKTWFVPAHREADVNRLKLKFIGKDDVAAAVVTMPETVEAPPELPDLDIELNLPRKLFAFQEKGVAYCRKNKRVIIGDQPGLGKTTQAIAAVSSFGVTNNLLNVGPGLVICPSSLKLNWQKEWTEVAGRRSMILTDKVKNTWYQYYKVGMVDVFIVNYESLKKYFVTPGWKKPKEGQFKLNEIPFRDIINTFKWVMVDESHKCKDGTTQQTKFVMGITRGKEFVFELTGTPVVNKPKDLIPQLHIIDRLKDIVDHIPRPVDKHGKLIDASGYTRFINRYCGGGNSATNLKELNYRLNLHCFYRREKSEVLKQLPAKMRQVILCEISNRTEYEKAEHEFVNYLKTVRGCTDSEVQRKLRGEVMVKMGILKQISARGKSEAVKDYVDEIVDSGEKVVIFCSLREIGNKLKEMYPTAVMIRGGMTSEEKDASVTQFQNNPGTKVIICSIKAAGVGLTLTASSRVVFVEFPWTFADCEQCEDRTHRIGQDESVQCAYMLGEETIDRYCYYDIIQKKKAIAQTITGAVDDVAEEVIDQLYNLFNIK